MHKKKVNHDALKISLPPYTKSKFTTTYQSYEYGVVKECTDF